MACSITSGSSLFESYVTVCTPTIGLELHFLLQICHVNRPAVRYSLDEFG